VTVQVYGLGLEPNRMSSNIASIHDSGHLLDVEVDGKREYWGWLPDYDDN